MQSTSDKCKQQKEKKYGVSYWSLMTKVTVTQCFSCNKRSHILMFPVMTSTLRQAQF